MKYYLRPNKDEDTAYPRHIHGGADLSKKTPNKLFDLNEDQLSRPKKFRELDEIIKESNEEEDKHTDG